MRPWDIFRQSAGCLTLLFIFCVGTFFGYLLKRIDDSSTPYIDQPTAIRYAVDYARDLCVRDDHPRPVECTTGRVKTEIENKDGWSITIWSADGRRSYTMLVDRKGKTEAEDPRDADDPRLQAPDKPPMPKEAALPSTIKTTK